VTLRSAGFGFLPNKKYFAGAGTFRFAAAFIWWRWTGDGARLLRPDALYPLLTGSAPDAPYLGTSATTRPLDPVKP